MDEKYRFTGLSLSTLISRAKLYVGYVVHEFLLKERWGNYLWFLLIFVWLFRLVYLGLRRSVSAELFPFIIMLLFYSAIFLITPLEFVFHLDTTFHRLFIQLYPLLILASLDGIDYKNQVMTVNFTWEEGDRLRTAVYIFGWKTHRKKIRQWFRKICQDKVTLVGQYFKFDLLYLYMSGDPVLAYWIDPRRLIVDDTLLWSFLYNEQQPEKGLKELSLLYGIADYSKLTVTGKSGNAKSCRDKNLHYYNCLDGAVTHTLRSDFLGYI